MSKKGFFLQFTNTGLLDRGNKGKKKRHRRLLGNSLVIHLAGARTAEAR